MKLLCTIPLFAISLLATPALAATPSGLLNKTITTSFAVSIPARAADGSVLNATRQVRKTIYVSGAGRIFAETARRGGRSSQLKQSGPDVTGAAFRFEGSKLVGVLRVGTGATQLMIAFDSGFQTCTAQVITGGENGGRMTWTGLNGIKYTSTGPATASTPSCSISEGNTFAR